MIVFCAHAVNSPQYVLQSQSLAEIL